MSLSVLFYSEYGKMSNKLYNMMKDSNLFNIQYINVDNKEIADRLQQNGIDELPVLLILNNTGEVSTLIGKECFQYFDSVLSNHIDSRKNKYNESINTPNTPINTLNIKKPKTSQILDEEIDENFIVTSNKLINKNIAMEKYMDNMKYNEIFDDTKRSILKEENKQSTQNQKENIEQKDINYDEVPDIPAPDSIQQSSNNKSSNKKQSFDLDADPSGMGLKTLGGGSAASIGQMLADSRAEVKIIKNQE